MRAYISFFRLRFHLGLQYRGAAIAGIGTQIVWGLLQLTIFQVFYREYGNSFPMSMRGLTSYIWLQQAFLSLFNLWGFDYQIFEMIRSGDVSYELCKPQDIYHMWFARNMASRLSRTVLRAVPVLFVGFLLPEPYGMSLPFNLISFIIFLISLATGLLVLVSFFMVIYMICFFTTSSQGLRVFIIGIGEVLSGAIIPLPFFPDHVRKVLELSPFASMQNVPLQVYSGELRGYDSMKYLSIQLIWVGILITVGRLLSRRAVTKLTVMGG